MTGKSNKKERLLDAAAEAFWVNGFAATSLADIAEKADIPVGNIYYYFKTKASIAEGVAEIFHEETVQLLANIDRDYDDATGRIKSFFKTLRENADIRTKLGCPLAIGVREFTNSAPQAAHKTNEAFTTMVSWLSTLLSGHEVEDANQESINTIAGWQGYIVLAHSSGDKTILVDGLDRLEQNLLRKMS